MEFYQKINTLYKRDMDGNKKIILGKWANPDIEYLRTNTWDFTEKIDGTNIVVEYANGELNFGGRTKNANIPAPLANYLKDTFWPSLFYTNGLDNITLYGEGYGAGIQGGGKYRSDQSFILFDVKIGNFWLYPENVVEIADLLQIDSVPYLGEGTLGQAEDLVIRGLKSTFGDFEAEGIVAKPQVQMFNRKGERIIAKIKGVDYKHLTVT